MSKKPPFPWLTYAIVTVIFPVLMVTAKIVLQSMNTANYSWLAVGIVTVLVWLVFSAWTVGAYVRYRRG